MNINRRIAVFAAGAPVKQLICFHRTKRKINAQEILRAGANHSAAEMYGSGFYTTYNIKSQLKPRMVKTYGEYIIKAKVNIGNFLVCDYKRFNYPPIIEQLAAKKFNTQKFTAKVARERRYYKEWIDSDRSYYDEDLFDVDSKYTSHIARLCLDLYRFADLSQKFSGIIYTGENDGNCCVAWNLATVTPLAIALVPKLSPPAQWEKLSGGGGATPSGDLTKLKSQDLRGIIKSTIRSGDKDRQAKLSQSLLADPKLARRLLSINYTPVADNAERIWRAVFKILESLDLAKSPSSSLDFTLARILITPLWQSVVAKLKTLGEQSSSNVDGVEIQSGPTDDNIRYALKIWSTPDKTGYNATYLSFYSIARQFNKTRWKSLRTWVTKLFILECSKQQLAANIRKTAVEKLNH